MWTPWPNAAELGSWPLRLAVAVSYLPLLVAGLWGAAVTWRRGWPYRLCVLPACYFTVLHVIFVSSIRYREPAMLPLLALAAGLLDSWINSGRVAASVPRAG
jgi:hypothetical protein